MENSYDGPKIQVVIRKRPLSQKEILKGETDIIEVSAQTVIVRETKTKVDLTKFIEEHHFNFDRTFGEEITNDQIYDEIVHPLISAAFKKTKITFFAYGQTGSGKTYTMLGNSIGSEGANTGLYLLAAQEIFNFLERPEYRHLTCWISFYEIYCGKLFDLLNERQILFAREDNKQNVNIVGLQEKKINNVKTLMQIIEFGNSVRVTGVTAANVDSSRSHAILQIHLREGNKSYSKLSFIDLAGSERGADTIDTDKQTRLDGAEIKKSLLALKECIRALDQNKRYTPFRGSKLTMVLKDSFHGDCRTVMIGAISPSLSNCEHTLNTLRYADRVKELRRPPNEKELYDLNADDLLAKELMLPRQKHNIYKVPLKEESPLFAPIPYQQRPLIPTPSQTLFPPNYSDKPIKVTDTLRPKTSNNSNPVANNQQPVSSKKKPSSSQSQKQPILTKNTSKDGYFQTKAPPQPMKLDPLENSPPLFTNVITREQIMNWHATSEEDLQLMGQKHEELIGIILNEEEEVVASHRTHIDDMVELVKQEMKLLHEVDKPGSDIDEYVENLDAILDHKMDMIRQIKRRIQIFREHLKEEELLSKKFYEQRAELLDVFDLNGKEGDGNEDVKLLENLPDYK